MSSDPIDFKYAMICQVSSNVFCLFYPLASSFFFHFDFLGSTFPIFCFKKKNFLKTDIKIQNKTMKSLWFLFQFFPPHLSTIKLISFPISTWFFVWFSFAFIELKNTSPVSLLLFFFLIYCYVWRVLPPITEELTVSARSSFFQDSIWLWFWPCGFTGTERRPRLIHSLIHLFSKHHRALTGMCQTLL